MKIKTHVWNDKKKKGVAVVEVDVEDADNDGQKKDLPDHNIALHLLGYENLNVGLVEEDQESDDVSKIADF